jgi:peptide/nickel transport system substrate-binding protein
VRQAVSLALNRQAISDAEMGGMAALEGNWIPSDWPGAIERPKPEENLDKAKQLLAEAGVPNGFEVSKLTPLGGYDSWGERLVTQLRAVGIKTQLNIMERAAFYEALAPGEKHVKGFVMQLSGSPGDAAARVRENTLCKGTFSSLCMPEIEEPMKKYDSSTDQAERKKLLDQVQNYLLDQYLIIPVLRQALPHAVGPRIANDIKDIEGAIPQYVYLGPYEDLTLKE